MVKFIKQASRIQIILIELLLVGGLLSCNNVSNTKIDLSANEDQKEAAFKQIMNDPQLMNEFMNEMMQNPGSMHYMMENENFMHHMLTGENLEYMMEHNHRFEEETMHYMMDHFRSDSSMRSGEMMHEGENMN